MGFGYKDRQSYSSKKSYGNKTKISRSITFILSYSSKKSYGNKTTISNMSKELESYSSKKSYGNKTSKKII